MITAIDIYPHPIPQASSDYSDTEEAFGSVLQSLCYEGLNNQSHTHSSRKKKDSFITDLKVLLNLLASSIKYYFSLFIIKIYQYF